MSAPALLKLIFPDILESLTKVVICSNQSGTCPSALKLAQVTAVHKSGPASDQNNFRPISTHLMLSLRSFNLIVSTQSFSRESVLRFGTVFLIRLKY